MALGAVGAGNEVAGDGLLEVGQPVLCFLGAGAQLALAGGRQLLYVGVWGCGGVMWVYVCG